MRSTLPSVLEEFEFEVPPQAPTTTTAASANMDFRTFILTLSLQLLQDCQPDCNSSHPGPLTIPAPRSGQAAYVPWLVITDPFPPSFNLGPVPIRFYGLAYAIAFIAGTAVAGRHMARRAGPPNVTNDIAFWAILLRLTRPPPHFHAHPLSWLSLPPP